MKAVVVINHHRYPPPPPPPPLSPPPPPPLSPPLPLPLIIIIIIIIMQVLVREAFEPLVDIIDLPDKNVTATPHEHALQRTEDDKERSISCLHSHISYRTTLAVLLPVDLN